MDFPNRSLANITNLARQVDWKEVQGNAQLRLMWGTETQIKSIQG